MGFSDVQDDTFIFDYFSCNYNEGKTGNRNDGELIRWGRAFFHGEKPRGVILLLNGRFEFMEKYRSQVHQLTQRGFHVISMDWRGQGLSLRELDNRQKGYVETFEDYLKDLRYLFHNHVKPLNLPVTILAHSMGGHITLRFLAEYAGEYEDGMQNFIQNAILVSPMIDINTAPIPRFMAGFIADAAMVLGLGESYVPGGGDYNLDSFKFENNKLTHDPEMFKIEHDEIQKNPGLALGGVTWGWLKAAFDSIELLRSAGHVSAIKIPVMILSAGEDRVVSNQAQKKTAKAIHGCEFVSVPGARHEILFETKEIRKFFWQSFDEFLNSSLN